MSKAFERVRSVDLLRGAAMALMAIDHVRVYSGVPAGGPTPGVFFTRWVTHYSAPAFAFLAGASAFLLLSRRGNARETAGFLAWRGMVLVVLELTLIRTLWTFNFDVRHYVLLGVIWMLGWCMIALAAMMRAPLRFVTVVGLILVFLQDLVGAALRAAAAPFGGRADWLVQILYSGGFIETDNGPTIAVLYSLIPWIGVMALGFAFGSILLRDAAARRRLCLRIGLAATALFVIGAVASAMSATPEQPMPFVFRVLAQRKYPASQLFLLMTLGPMIALLPLVEHARGWLAGVLEIFGKTPMFFYLLHIPLIHGMAIVVSRLRSGHVDPWLFGNHPMMPPPVPDGYRWNLLLLYAVWMVVLVVLYFACRWYAGVKARSGNSLLRFI